MSMCTYKHDEISNKAKLRSKVNDNFLLIEDGGLQFVYFYYLIAKLEIDCSEGKKGELLLDYYW